MQINHYIRLTKPQVLLLMLFTVWVGMALSPVESVSCSKILGSSLGITFFCAGSAVLNHLFDKDIDRLMERTQNRPLVQDVLTQKEAGLFAMGLFISGAFFLIYFANYQTLFLAVLASCGYGFLYTLYLKYATPQNIVIGGLYGALPPLLGWVALTDSIDPQAWLLVLLIYVWTPPHFWALAIERVNEYKEAGVPMLPVTHGEKFTAFLMLCYTVLLLPVCWLLILSGLGSYFFLFVSSALTIWYFFINLKIYQGSYGTSKKSFLFSIGYLYALFFSLLLEKFLGVF